MPVNYPQLQDQIRKLGSLAPQQQAQLRERWEKAENQLQAYAAELEGLQALVDQAASLDKNLRCAVPLKERLDFRGAAAGLLEGVVLLAADGSQINPNRHEAVDFSLINIGAIRLRLGIAETPREYVQTSLVDEDDPDNPGRLTEEVVALKRDLKERSALFEMACTEQGLVATLTDGPLELFREPGGPNDNYRNTLKSYLNVLEQMASLNLITAGYVDKPRSDLVVRLLELTLAGENDLRKVMEDRPLRGVTDAMLFQHLLESGERSAMFELQSPSVDVFKNRSQALAIYFFYLNVSRNEKPHLARVEIPAWVGRQPELVNTLQALLLQQCLPLGQRPYPYALHRSHEIALVSFQERAQIEQMIQAEFLRQGLEPGEKSHKQSLKDLQGRTGYKK